MHRFSRLVALVLVALAGCGSDAPAPPSKGSTVTGGVFCPEDMDTTICVGGALVECKKDGSHKEIQDCLADKLSCFPSTGCSECEPGAGSCDGNTTLRCREDGSGYDEGSACEGTEASQCDIRNGTCVDLCAKTEEDNSYIGCDYWVATTTNMVANDFTFAVVVTNPQAVPAEVTITQGGTVFDSLVVMPGEVSTVPLPWVPSLKDAMATSVLAVDGAYHLVASVPVAVYQFSPLEFEIPRDCAIVDAEEATDVPGDNSCNSYTNDASLLFPTHVLKGKYQALALPGQRTIQELASLDSNSIIRSSSRDIPAFVAIVGAGTEATEVTVTTPAHLYGVDGTEIGAQAPGDSFTVSLAPGDVLEMLSGAPEGNLCPPAEYAEDAYEGLCEDEFGGTFNCRQSLSYCALGADYDVTGISVDADGPVAVIAGHRCAFVPEYRFACDHLEDALPPLETWGKEYVLNPTKALRGEPNLIRVLASQDGTTITFSGDDFDEVSLDAGEVHEFEADRPVSLRGSKPILVSQFVVGQDYAGLGSSTLGSSGDPAMGIAVPIEQYRESYDFLVPATYVESYIGIVAALSQDVLVDGKPIKGWKRVDDTGYKAVSVELKAGAHRATSLEPFGLIVYGYAPYTSYLYPGGLDFRPINPVL